MPLPRPLSFALTSVLRNPLLTLATVAVMALVIFVFNIIVAVNLMAGSAIADLNAKMDLRAEILDGADTTAVENLQKDLKKMPEVSEVIFVSKDQAFADFKKRFPDKAAFLETYGYQNPLPASLIIKVQRAEEHTAVRSFLFQAEYGKIIATNFGSEDTDLQKISAKLAQVTTTVRNVIFWVVLVFIAGGLLIILNTINLTVFQRRREIGIMKLVGASLNFIRLPFLIEGAFLGGGSVILGVLLFFFFLFYTGLNNFAELNLAWPFWFLFFWQFLVGVIVGMASSFFAAEKYVGGGSV